MEKNVYQILQDWHELLKAGAISESEFQSKKIELLEKDKTEQSSNTKEIFVNPSINNQTIIIEESKPRFNYKHWLQKNKIIVIIIAFVITSISIWYYYTYIREGSFNNPILDTETTTQLPAQVSEKSIGYYIVLADTSNYVYFYRQPDISTKKNAHFESSEKVYIQKVENDFGYVDFKNEMGQTSSGWIRMQDLSSARQ
jgi:hypothetical protein